MKSFFVAAFSFFFLAAASVAAPLDSDLSQLQAETGALFSPSRDLAEVKLSVDRMVDPAVDVDAGVAVLDRMASSIKTMMPATASQAERLAALKRHLYQEGPRNEGKAFQYDLSDPLSETLASRQITRYLDTRRGNCVTMPILFLLLGERIGLNVTLAEAPLHLFVKYIDDDTEVWNLKTTSGAGFTRDLWYSQKLPMTDKAVANGVYMRGLSREETVAAMAASLVEHYLDNGAYEKAIAVSDVILRHYPNSAYVLAKKRTAYYRLLQRDITSKYTRVSDIPPNLRARADIWYAENNAAFNKAEALGWRLQDG